MADADWMGGLKEQEDRFLAEPPEYEWVREGSSFWIFDDAGQFLFQGKGVDDLLFPMHMNFRFFGMEPLPTFACFDVMKNAEVENDFKRFAAHLGENF